MMRRSAFRLDLCAVLGLGLPVLLAGCNVKVNKNGDGKDVNIHIPLGGLEVHENATTAQSIGLAPYPGATAVADHDGDSSADVHIGFGDWQLRLRAATYQTADAPDKVSGYYRNALGQYGTVIECRNGHAVGTPATTRDGLSCEDKGPHNKGIHIQDADHDLRAGSKRHRHQVAIESKDGGTKFTLLQLDLPAGLDNGDSAQ